MQNSLAPGFVIARYTTNGHQHRMVLPVKPAAVYTPGQIPSFLGYNNTSSTITQFSANLSLYLKPMFAATGTYDGIEYWQKPTKDDDPVFISASDEASGVGTNATAVVPYSELVMTFRTKGGGILKNYFLECSFSPNVRISAPLYNGSTPCVNWLSFLISVDSPILGRDGTYPLMGLHAATKTNDILRKKYLFA